MSGLAQQQAALLQALFCWPASEAMEKIAAYALDTDSRGLKAYQANGHALAVRALSAAYPVLVQLLGEESFADLARALWHAHPPQCGDVAQWGDALAAFVEASTQLQEEPYLADMARLEWHLHRCATQKDETPQPGSLALLTQNDPAQLRLLLAPGTAVLCSPWPIASLMSAHLDGVPDFSEVGQMVASQVAQDVVVWREGFRPMFRQAQVGEADWMKSLLDGRSLGEALACHPDIDFAHWFPVAIQSGLVLGAALIEPSNAGTSSAGAVHG